MRDENKTNSSDCNAECRICNMHYRNIYTHGVNGFYKKPSVSINRFFFHLCIILDKNFAQMKEEEEETADTEENPEDSQETEEKTSEAEPTTEEEPEENVEI